LIVVRAFSIGESSNEKGWAAGQNHDQKSNEISRLEFQYGITRAPVPSPVAPCIHGKRQFIGLAECGQKKGHEEWNHGTYPLPDIPLKVQAAGYLRIFDSHAFFEEDGNETDSDRKHHRDILVWDTEFS